MLRQMSGMGRCEKCIREHRSLAYCLQTHPQLQRICKLPNAAALHMRMVRALVKERARQEEEEERQRIEREHALQMLAEREKTAEQARQQAEEDRKRQQREEDEAPPIRQTRPRPQNRQQQVQSSDGEECLALELRNDGEGSEGDSDEEENDQRLSKDDEEEQQKDVKEGGNIYCPSRGHQLQPETRGSRMVKMVHQMQGKLTRVPFTCEVEAPFDESRAQMGCQDKLLPIVMQQGGGAPRAPTHGTMLPISEYALVAPIPTGIPSTVLTHMQQKLGKGRVHYHILATLEHICTKCDVIEVCGAGAYGIVFKCIAGHAGETVAIKVFTHKLPAFASERCTREHKMLRELSSGDMSASVQGGDAVAQLARCSALAEDGLIYVEGQARAIVMRHFQTHQLGQDTDPWYCPSPALVHGYMRELFRAIQYLEHSMILHFDVKPANFLYNADDRKGCLVDLGLARSYGSSAFVGRVGTPGFRAPEISSRNPWRMPPHTWTSSAPDVWSAGVCMLLLLKGTHRADVDMETKLHDSFSRHQVIQDTVLAWSHRWPEKHSGDLALCRPHTPIGKANADQVRDFLDKILHLNHTQRPTATRALDLMGTTATLWEQDVATQRPSQC